MDRNPPIKTQERSLLSPHISFVSCVVRDMIDNSAAQILHDTAWTSQFDRILLD